MPRILDNGRAECVNCGHTWDSTGSIYTCPDCGGEYCRACAHACHLCAGDMCPHADCEGVVMLDTACCAGNAAHYSCAHDCPECGNRVCCSCDTPCSSCESTYSVEEVPYSYNHTERLETPSDTVLPTITYGNLTFPIPFPTTLNLGVELEYTSAEGTPPYTSWVRKPDGSLPSSGREFNSPILYGNGALTYLASAVTYYARRGVHTSTSCGIHFHLSPREGRWDSDPRTIRRMFIAWNAIQQLLYVTQGKSRISNTYCKPIYYPLRLAHNTYNAASLAGRYVGMNLESLGTHHTIEFRFMSASTVPARVVIPIAIVAWIAHSALTGQRWSLPPFMYAPLTSNTARFDWVKSLLPPELREPFGTWWRKRVAETTRAAGVVASVDDILETMVAASIYPACVDDRELHDHEARLFLRAIASAAIETSPTRRNLHRDLTRLLPMFDEIRGMLRDWYAARDVYNVQVNVPAARMLITGLEATSNLDNRVDYSRILSLARDGELLASLSVHVVSPAVMGAASALSGRPRNAFYTGARGVPLYDPFALHSTYAETNDTEHTALLARALEATLHAA